MARAMVKSPRLSWSIQQRIFANAMLAPALILVLATLAVPIVAGIVTSVQRIRINMDLTVRGPAPAKDSIREVVSYEHLVVGVREMVTVQHLHLIETLADRIADLCLADARVLGVTVRVEKLDVFADCASVGVEIARSR